jgi:putative effector of murein hydrolase
MALAMAAVTSPLLASYSLELGGPSLVAAATLVVGLTGAALCLPLARVLDRPAGTPTVHANPVASYA